MTTKEKIIEFIKNNIDDVYEDIQNLLEEICPAYCEKCPYSFICSDSEKYL